MAANPYKKLGVRILVIRCFLLLCLVGIVIRSFDIQIIQGDVLRKKAENTYVRQITIQGERGLILDRHLNKLGASIDAPNITADPTQVKNARQTAGQLAKILGGSRTEMEKNYPKNAGLRFWQAGYLRPRQKRLKS